MRKRVRSKINADMKYGFLVMQLLLCMILMLSVFVIKFIGGSVYMNVRTKYIELFEDTTSANDVIKTVKVFFTSGVSSVDNQDSSQTSQSDSILNASLIVSEISDSSDDDPLSNSDSNTTTSENESSDVTDSTGSLLTNKVVGVSGNTVASVEATIVKSVLINTMCIPTVGRITDEFGYRTHPITGKYLMHKGMDFGANTGDDIYSVLDGTVYATGSNSSYGNYVIILHSTNMKTLYAHCKKVLVKKGESVSKGDVIALIGNTGVTTGPHLHFEVIINSTRINPRWVLPPLN